MLHRSLQLRRQLKIPFPRLPGLSAWPAPGKLNQCLHPCRHLEVQFPSIVQSFLGLKLRLFQECFIRLLCSSPLQDISNVPRVFSLACSRYPSSKSTGFDGPVVSAVEELLNHGLHSWGSGRASHRDQVTPFFCSTSFSQALFHEVHGIRSSLCITPRSVLNLSKHAQDNECE